MHAAARSSLPHTQVNINDFPSVANNLLTECWDTGACYVTRVTRLHDEVLSGCMTRACWCMTKCSLSALASAEQVPVRGGASEARAAEPGCNKRSLESSNSIYTLYLHYLPPGPGVHVCIILEFTQNPGLRSGAGWTMDGTEDSWLVGWLWPGVEVCWNFHLHAGGDGGPRAQADCRQYEWSRETAENTTYDPLPTGYPPLVKSFHKCISCIWSSRCVLWSFQTSFVANLCKFYSIVNMGDLHLQLEREHRGME